MTEEPGMSPVSDDELATGVVRSGRLESLEAPPQVTIGAILDRSWAVFTKRLGPIAGLAFIPAAIVLAAVAVAFVLLGAADFFSNTEDGPKFNFEWGDGSGRVEGLVALGVVAMLAMIAVSIVVQAATIWIGFGQLRQRPAGFGEAFGVGVRRAVPLLVAGLASGLLVLLLAGIPTGIGIAIAAASDGGLKEFHPAILVGISGSVVIAMILLAGLWLVTPVVVAEGRSISAIGRSWTLSRGYRGKLFLVIFLLQALSAAVGAVPLVGPILQVLAGGFVTIAAAVSYYAVRAAKEGIGMDQLTSVFD